MNWQRYLNVIPRKHFLTKFSRSSGPGGQNVNKVNTKATIKLCREKLLTASWLEPELREKISSSEFMFTTPKGDLVISSELTRSQHLNLEDCFEKLSKGIAKAAFTPREPSQKSEERWEKLAARESRKTQEIKKRHSAKKKDRGNIID